MNDIFEIRRLNMLRLTDIRGDKAELARRTRLTPNRLSQLLADPTKVQKPARITADTARLIELKMGWPRDSLDTPGGGAAEAPTDRLLFIVEVARADGGNINDIQFVLTLADKLGISPDVNSMVTILRYARADANGGALRESCVNELLSLTAPGVPK